MSVVKLGAGIDDGFPFRTGTVGFEGDVRCDSRGLRRFGRAGRPPPLQSGPGIGRGRAGGRAGGVGGARGASRRGSRATAGDGSGVPGDHRRARARPRVPATSRKKKIARARGHAGARGGPGAGARVDAPHAPVQNLRERGRRARRRGGNRGRLRETRDRATEHRPRARARPTVTAWSGGARGTDKPPGRQRISSTRSDESQPNESLEGSSRGLLLGFSSVLTTLWRTRGARRPSSSLHFRASAICFSTTGRSSGHAAA